MSRGALIARFVTTYPAVHCVFIRHMKCETVFFWFFFKGTLQKTDSLSALNGEDNWVYLSLTMETRARRQIFKGKVQGDGKNDFDASRRRWSDTAVNLLFVQEKNPRLQRDSWGCSPQRGTDSFKNAAECRYESEPNRVPSGEKKKWQYEANVLAGEGLQCSISLVPHSMTASAFSGYRNIAINGMACSNVEKTALKF